MKEYGIDFAATRKALRERSTTKRAAHIITQLAAGTYPIGSRLQKIGFMTDGICPLCEEGPDTLPRRLWRCSELEAAREKYMPEGVVSWAKAGGQHTMLGMFCLGTKK